MCKDCPSDPPGESAMMLVLARKSVNLAAELWEQQISLLELFFKSFWLAWNISVTYFLSSGKYLIIKNNGVFFFFNLFESKSQWEFY